MARQSSLSTTKYTVLSEMSPLRKKKDSAYTIGLRQWQRLKSDVESIPQSFNWWTVGWSIFFGATTSFFGVALTAQTNRSWYWGFTAVSFVGFVVTLIASRKISRITGSSRSNVLNRMKEVEEDHEQPDELTEKPNNITVRYT